MKMSGLQSLIVGFVSGFAEMLPISADAHHLILRTIFGAASGDALFRLFCHLAILAMMLWLFQPDIRHLRRTYRLMKIPPRRRRQKLDVAGSYTIRLLRLSVCIMLVMRLILWKFNVIDNRPAFMTLTLAINGVILLLPSLIRSGNKDSRNMSKLNGIFLGIAAGLGGIPGISHVGCVASVAAVSAVDRSYALRFAYLLLIPGLMMDALFDLAAIITGGLTGFGGKLLLLSLLGAAAAAWATYLGTRLMRWITQKRGLDCFAYYCWGAALLCYILFLIV